MLTLLSCWHCCHVDTVVMLTLLSCWYCCHVATAVMLTLLSCWHCCHVDTVVMLILLSCWHCRHVDTAVMLTLPSCWHCRHVDTAVMLTLLLCWQFCHVDIIGAIYRSEQDKYTTNTTIAPDGYLEFEMIQSTDGAVVNTKTDNKLTKSSKRPPPLATQLSTVSLGGIKDQLSYKKRPVSQTNWSVDNLQRIACTVYVCFGWLGAFTRAPDSFELVFNETHGTYLRVGVRLLSRETLL